MDRRLVTAVAAGIAVGVIAGSAITALLAEWPAMCKVDGALIWTALSAIGSIGAAVGAVYAAGKAIAAAKIPVTASDASRRAQARVIAAAIESELMAATMISSQLKIMIPASMGGQRYELLERIPSMRVNQTAMLDRFLGSFDVFGVDDGATIAIAAAAILNLNGSIDTIAGWKYDRINPAVFSAWETLRLHGLEGQAGIVGDFSRKAQEIVSAHV